MANRERWCAEKISKLSNEELRILTLNEIKEYFLALPQDEANQTANLIQLPIVFDCLNDSKSEQIDLACDVLSLCMSNLSLGESTNRYGTFLERTLYHPCPNVKIMALTEIFRTASNPESISELNKQNSLIIALIVCIGDDDLSVAQKATKILTLIGKTKEGIRQLLSSEIKQVISQTIAISDIVRYRIYEVVVDIAMDSDESLQSLLPSGLINSLICELDSDDPLLKLNVVELLSTLAQSNHGLNFLEGQGIIKKIIDNISSLNRDPLAALIIPGFIKFFGNVAHLKPTEMFSQYPTAINIVFDIINSGDLSTIGVAFDTLGHIGSTNNGKFALQSTDPRMSATLISIGKQISSLPTDLQIRALNCLETLLYLGITDQTNRSESLTENWFAQLHSDPMNLILSHAQNPFVEIRCAGLGVLRALAGQLWGQQLIKNCPGLVEFLMDRQAETAKGPKDLKYEIVRSLSVSSLFSEDILLRLQQFVKEGPFYVRAVTEVAVEGGD